MSITGQDQGQAFLNKVEMNVKSVRAFILNKTEIQINFSLGMFCFMSEKIAYLSVCWK